MKKAPRARAPGFFRNTTGSNLVEYIVIVGLVALVALLGFKKFGRAVLAKISEQGMAVASIEGGGGGEDGCLGGLCTNGNCFVAGTLVATPDGDRPIEQLRVDDIVLTRDEETLAVAPHRVLKTIVTPEMPIVSVRVREAPGEAIRATPGHRFWTEDHGWVEAASLVAGEPLVAADGRVLHVEGVASEPARETVYNFEVEDTHTYFVGAARVLVHNPTGPTGCGGAGGGGSGGSSGGGSSGGSGGAVAAGGSGSGVSGGTSAGGAASAAPASSGAPASPSVLNGSSPGSATSGPGTVYSTSNSGASAVAIPSSATTMAANGPTATTTGKVKIGNKNKPTVTLGGQTYVGGETYKNKDGALPKTDASGNPITYKEYDVNPYTPGVNRGNQRVVHGSDGRNYYTNDHYGSFTQF